MICTQCYTQQEKGRIYTPGSILIEGVLYLCFVVPGLIYSLWRISARRRVCVSCGGGALVADDSPFGSRVLGVDWVRMVRNPPNPCVGAYGKRETVAEKGRTGDYGTTLLG